MVRFGQNNNEFHLASSPRRLDASATISARGVLEQSFEFRPKKTNFGRISPISVQGGKNIYEAKVFEFW